MSKKTSLVLGLEFNRKAGTYTISKGNPPREQITLEEARKLWESGKVDDYNMAFHRLATRANWDFEELSRQYDEMDAAQR